MDALRAIAMLLGVVLHGVVSYMQQPMPGLIWPVHDQQTSPTMDWLFWWIHGFRIPLFFLIAGFFARMLIDLRGPGAFIRHRIRRIAIPSLLATFTILIGTFYVWWMGLYLTERSTVREMKRWEFESLEIQAGMLGPAHLWFLNYLFLICVGYWLLVLLWRRFGRSHPAAAGNPDERTWLDRLLDSRWRVLVFTIPTCGIVALQPELMIEFENQWLPDPVDLAFYTWFFIVGAVMFRHHDSMDRYIPMSGVYLIASVGVFVWLMWLTKAYLAHLQGGPWTMAQHAQLIMATALFAWLGVFGFLGLFLRVFRDATGWLRYLSDAAYWIYLIHLPLVGLVQIDLMYLSWPAEVKGVIVIGVTTLLALMSYRVFIRYTPIGTMLNGRRYRPGTARPPREPEPATPTRAPIALANRR